MTELQCRCIAMFNCFIKLFKTRLANRSLMSISNFTLCNQYPVVQLNQKVALLHPNHGNPHHSLDNGLTALWAQ